MGSRSSFKDVSAKDLRFTEGGKTYRSVGEIDGIKILIKEKGSVKAPEFSHTKNRIYGIVQNGALKHLAFYDENNRQSAVIDLQHKHGGLQPHKHLYLEHSDKGIPITATEKKLIEKIKKECKLK